MERTLRKISMELLVYTILFMVCLLVMPWAYFYFEGEGEEFMITEAQRFYDSILIVLFPVVFTALLCAFYSGSKAVSRCWTGKQPVAHEGNREMTPDLLCAYCICFQPSH